MKKLLQEEIIRPSQSEWNFPILMVPKELDVSGKRKLRMIIDFRKLKENLIGDGYPLPNIQDILDKIGNLDTLRL